MSHAAPMALTLLALWVGIAGQTTQRPTDHAAREAAIRIAALSDRLDPEIGRGLSAPQWQMEQESITARIRAEVRRFIETSVSPSEEPKAIELRLRAVLGAQRPVLEHTDPPTARMADLRFGRSLVVTYSVVRPPHFDTGRIFGYLEVAGALRLVDTAGSDFDGYTMFSLDVASPFPDSMMLLVGGQALTFNGARMRFRLYSFDGRRFRTEWTPDDILGASARVTSGGFAISYPVTEPPYTITEEYDVTINGVVKVR